MEIFKDLKEGINSGEWRDKWDQEGKLDFAEWMIENNDIDIV